MSAGAGLELLLALVDSADHRLAGTAVLDRGEGAGGIAFTADAPVTEELRCPEGPVIELELLSGVVSQGARVFLGSVLKFA